MTDKNLTPGQILAQCRVRISTRAKYMRLSVSLEKGVEIVVPHSMPQGRANQLIPQFINKQQHWINTTLQRLMSQQRQKPALVDCPLPDSIALKAFGKEFKLEYNELDINTLLLRTHLPDTLIISGALNDRYHVFKLLEQYFKKLACRILYQRLSQMSEKTGLRFNRLTVRAQKTRWGSCSAKKNINLNYRLLFIDTHLLDYILLHELVHTVHLNHSPAFWELGEQFMPDFRYRDKQVNLIRKELPCWIFYKELHAS